MLSLNSLIFLLIGIALGFLLSPNDSNSKLEYGETGLPKNCRAIIRSNYVGYRLGEFDADGALDSINRNCGEFGYSWN
ncbi:MAG: hypothetical protein A2383_02565 [Candidatus Pacebacteria bacterium RIFOXYB1_FULL_39_46]|nr:MAG: hypothetical protein A2383_02565 [Candidatus Pacebacteria bacterium RIFOXYB1_FULL_39_46]OGJ39314.1 MAG: hypothetical protein A2182_02830 [Candidatus Pacebacteria bacterium RIFOXYA1_FULL_38_18]OGJ41173.1 MAG: hypothetical protein A2411_01410 [Candidatus Pacebacteria bacterium RIFOXYC1_FULL_39_21]